MTTGHFPVTGVTGTTDKAPESRWLVVPEATRESPAPRELSVETYALQLTVCVPFAFPTFSREKLALITFPARYGPVTVTELTV